MPDLLPVRLLLLEDSDSDEALVLTQLRRGGLAPSVVRVETREDFTRELNRGALDLIIADYALPSFSALEALHIFKANGLDVPFILVSGTVGEEVAVEAMKAGAHDYLLKDKLVRLVPAIRRELKDAEERAGRRKAEQALRESIDLFSLVFRASPDAMVVIEAQTRKIVEVNESHQRLFGYSKEEARGRLSVELGGWGSPADFERFFEKLRTDGTVRNFEAVRRNRQGEPIVTLNSAEIIELGGRRCIVVVARDITEWRNAQNAKSELEQQLQQSQKMDAVGKLAGGIAHDFNNILTAIVGNAQLADMELAEGQAAKEPIRQALAASMRAKELIKQIMIFSRREELRRDPIRLADCVRDSLRLLRATMPSTIEIKAALPAGSPMILGDATQILQVVLNLASNATHAMEAAGGCLAVAVEAVLVDAETARLRPRLRTGHYVRLRMTDTGCGMEPAVLGRIFEPFFTTKQAGEGTGLGLSVLHGIVEQHDGAVFVESEVGRGTTFTLYFPEWQGAPAAATAAEPASACGRGQRIMVVDDETIITTMTERVLRRSGYEVGTFNDPRLALEAFRADPKAFALVLTDLTMPGLKGTALAEAVWRMLPGFPVIISTGFAEILDLEPYRVMGMRGPLLKPYTADALLAAVADSLA